jgi:hypothetical protein
MIRMAGFSGFDQLQRDLAEAQAALSAMDGEIGKLKFDPADSASVESAVRTMERMVDDKAGQYGSNPIAGPFIVKSKEAFAAAIRARARRTL